MRISGPMVNLIAIFLLLYSSLAYAEPSNSEYVVILHGIARSSAHMQPLADFLEGEGYTVINIDYSSTQYSMEELIKLTASDIDTLILDKGRTINFVGYSMGALIAQGIVSTNRPEHLGRVVLRSPQPWQ